jgi:hypothetical protein
MGTLIGLHEIKADGAPKVPWYFDDAYYSADGRGTYRFDWPSKNFPHMVSIHEDIMIEVGNKPKIRRWVEQQITETVIYDVVDKSYRIYYTKDLDWDRSHRVTNNWYRLWFENEESALAFKLKFGNIVSPITDTHPTRHYEPVF